MSKAQTVSTPTELTYKTRVSNSGFSIGFTIYESGEDFGGVILPGKCLGTFTLGKTQGEVMDQTLKDKPEIVQAVLNKMIQDKSERVTSDGSIIKRFIPRSEFQSN